MTKPREVLVREEIPCSVVVSRWTGNGSEGITIQISDEGDRRRIWTLGMTPHDFALALTARLTTKQTMHLLETKV